MQTDQAISIYDAGLSAKMPLYVGTRSSGPSPLALDMHEGIEIGILMQGMQERQWQDFSYNVNRGDCWLCATWEPHGHRVLVPDTQDMHAVFLPSFLGDEILGDISWLSLFAVPPSKRPTIDGPRQRERILYLCREILENLREGRLEGKSGWETGVRLALLNILFILSRNWQPPTAVNLFSRTQPSRLAQIIPALRLVHTLPLRRISIAEAAAVCHLSRTQFCCIFKQSMGISFGEFDMQSRLATAAKKLLDTDLPVEKIASLTGFSNASHLHNNFQKRYKCTPRVYRLKQSPLVEVRYKGLYPTFGTEEESDLYESAI